jgi:hypothetical protein
MSKISECGAVVLALAMAGCGSDGGGTAGAGGAGGRDGAATGDTANGGMTSSDGMTSSGGVTANGGVTSSGGITSSGGVATGGAAGAGTGGAAMDASADSAIPDTGAGGSDGGLDGGAPWLALPMVPPILAVPAGAALKLHDRGVGAQIYTCTASAGVDGGADGGATSFAWVLKAPDAELFDGSGTKVGTHGAGPHWTSTVDGNTVNGTKATQANAPSSTAIPWLLLRATSTAGTGVFSDVTYIQRVNTVGGKAPDGGCDAATVGGETSVGYSADYYFYTGGAGAAWLSAPNAPAALAVPAGATLKLHDRGIGTQVYTCTASGGIDGGGGGATYAWVLKAPDAILYDASFVQVGTHGAGPSWISPDGSSIAGTRLAQAASPSADAIPWLLLSAASTGAVGVFSDIAFVQRLNTSGGKAPAAGCDATSVGAETRVDYSADYYFFTGAMVDSGTAD